jgi:hypothetical protein
MADASQPVLDIVDRVDLGFEALPLAGHIVPESVITATLAVAQHGEPAVLLCPGHTKCLSADRTPTGTSG